MTEEERRYFTLDEANRTLPLVRRIVADIVDSYKDWRDKVQQYELLVGAAGAFEESPEQEEMRSRVDEIAGRINDYIGELEQIGCVLKGFDDGLVDFYTKMDGRDVFLCWRFGEPEISHWHETDIGFSGRKPITHELADTDVP